MPAWLAAAAPPLATVAAFDLPRYLGTWHQVAHLPNRFQAECARDTTADYSALPDGRLRVHNRCRRADGSLSEVVGVARRNPRYAEPGILQVRFAPAWLGWLPAVWGDYWIIAVTDDYSAALVGAPNREFLWILGRTPTLAPAVLDDLVARARSAGFAVDRLVYR